jgi:hypothetical protein
MSIAETPRPCLAARRKPAAWRKGITVIAATGNAGYYMTPGGAGLTSPARDPT